MKSLLWKLCLYPNRPVHVCFLFLRGCVQLINVNANVLPWIPVHNDERQQEQGSKAKHSRVTCTSQRSPGIIGNYDLWLWLFLDIFYTSIPRYLIYIMTYMVMFGVGCNFFYREPRIYLVQSLQSFVQGRQMTMMCFNLHSSLRKHAYSNKLKISPPRTEIFQIQNLISFIFLLKT